MKQKFIVRCTPSLGSVSIWWAKAMEDILWPMNHVKGVLYLRDVEGNEIAECRNKLVAQCLSFNSEDREVSALLWVDDDVICSSGVLMQLMSHDRDIVSGVYYTKHHFGEPILFPDLGAGTLKYVPAEDGEQKSQEVWMGSMGLSLVKMDVYARMRDELKLPLDRYGNPEWYRTTKGRADELKVVEGVLDCGGTEDTAFLANAHKLGYKPLADLTKYSFGWHYDARKQTGYPEAQWKQFLDHKPITWPQPDGSVITWR